MSTKVESQNSAVLRRGLQGSLPTFIGIGSMRCGSTWLYQVLRSHPDVRMSDLKEVDFFFLVPMLRHDWQWYKTLFGAHDPDEAKPVRGEISPRYSRLKGWQVNRIAELLPDLRVVLTLRHPVERAWSQTLYEFGRLQAKDIRKISSLEILRQLERPRNKLSSDYYRTIKIWSAAFGRNALHIDLFDDLRDNPQQYVNRVLEHIGASTPWSIPSEFVGKKAWATNTLVRHEREIPEVVEWYIADQLLKPTIQLNEYLEGRVSHWVDEMRTIQGATRTSWRILREVNRKLLSIPEKLAYEAYHLLLDTRYWLRWQQLRDSHVGMVR